MLVSSSEEQAFDIAERIPVHVESTPVTFDSREIKVQLSVGVASIDANDPGVVAVLKRADNALYCAKKQGRNRVVIA